MQLQIIKHKTGYIGVSDKPMDNLSDGNCFVYNSENGEIGFVDVNVLRQMQGRDKFKLSHNMPLTALYVHHLTKIICTTPDIKLEGIPLMMLEEDVEKLALEIIPEKIIYGENAGERDYDMYNPERINWIAGYNYRKETHPYSLEDMERMWYEAYESGNRESTSMKTFKEVLNEISESHTPKFITIESKEGVPVLENGYVKIISKQF